MITQLRMIFGNGSVWLSPSCVIKRVIPNTRVFTSGRRDLPLNRPGAQAKLHHYLMFGARLRASAIALKNPICCSSEEYYRQNKRCMNAS
jgi:hypothetical protein